MSNGEKNTKYLEIKQDQKKKKHNFRSLWLRVLFWDLPASGGQRQTLMCLEVVEDGLAQQKVTQHAATEAQKHTRQVTR
jgi:hypothetical protein